MRKLLCAVIVIIALSITLSACDFLSGITNDTVSIRSAAAELEYAEHTYTGDALCPEVTVVLGVETLSKDKISVTYTDNINAGTATVTVEGKGRYSGTIIRNFTITKLDISGLALSLAYDSVLYDGNPKEPAVTILECAAINDLTEYFDLSYVNNTSAGTATVTLTAKQTAQNFSGEASATFDITVTPVTLADADVMLETLSAVYSGNAIEVAVEEVNISGVRVPESMYDLTYQDNINAGTATVTITAKGGMCEGATTVNFEIIPKSLQGAEISLETLSSYVYDGNAKSPQVLSVSDGTFIFPQAAYSVIYSNNVNAGTAKVTVSASSDNYSGSEDIDFVIQKKNMSALTVITLIGNSYVYTGSAIRPSVSEVRIDGTPYAATSYNVSYSNNINAGAATVTVTAGVAITNYTGSASAIFTILKRDIEGAAAQLETLTDYSYDGTAKQPAVTGLNVQGISVTADNYNVAYADNINAGIAAVTITIKQESLNFTGEVQKSFTITKRSINGAVITLEGGSYIYDNTAKQPAVSAVEIVGVSLVTSDYAVSYYDNINAGQSTVTVTAAAEAANFTGYANAEFTIQPRSIADAVVQAAQCTYTGGSRTPALTVTVNGLGVLTVHTDYTASYSNNVDAGENTALVTVNGKGNYSASASQHFTIDRASLAAAVIVLEADRYRYTGAAVCPAVTGVTLGGSSLSVSCYSVSYCNNIDVGTAALATITGVGNYQGSAAKYFEIFGDELNEIILILEGSYFTTVTAAEGEAVAEPADPEVEGMQGWGTHWYTDSSYTNTFVFTVMPAAKSTTIYGRWEIEQGASLFGYQDYSPGTVIGQMTYNWRSRNVVRIDSFKELQDYAAYVNFYYIEEAQADLLYLAYYTGGDSYVRGQMSDALNTCGYPINAWSYTTHQSGTTVYGVMYVPYNDQDDMEATFTATGTLPIAFDSFNYRAFTATRAEDYDGFAINDAEKSVSVWTSNQLMFALQCGIKPLPQAGSDAESVYNRAKAVLREIISDDMTDYEKVTAIYEWFCQNVSYEMEENIRVDVSIIAQRLNFAEGPLLDGRSQCDGISRAFVILAQIEGINAVRVISSTAKHAWNRVEIEGQWYVIDNTWSMVGVRPGKVLYALPNYSQLLITEVKKEQECECVEDGAFTAFPGNGIYDYFAAAEFSYNGSSYDFVIESQSELNILMCYIFSLGSAISGKTVNFTVTFNYGASIDDEVNAAAGYADNFYNVVYDYRYTGIYYGTAYIIFQ